MSKFTPSIILLFVLTITPLHANGVNFSTKSKVALHRGVYELSLKAKQAKGNPFFQNWATIEFIRPDASRVMVDTFYDGDLTWRARAYCDQVGVWKWQSRSDNKSLANQNGQFEVVASELPGKLRKHPDDPYQFARDDGSWFLHIGDTGYRFVVATESRWQEYIDQAAAAGFTKIRTWFAQSRSTVEALYTKDRSALDLNYWREIDRRLRYALEQHPHMVFQLIPYAEDTDELKRYASGDKLAKLIGRESQARWSSFPNVYWAISNDREIVEKGKLSGRKVLRETINQIGQDFAKREPWGTLLTNHQSRFSGYDYVDAPWSDVVTLEDLDRVDGKMFEEFRKIASDPIINDEDRYELYRDAENKRYFFRRLMWASILSGGHATYGGLKTYEPCDGGPARGVRGYYDACRDGTLSQGAHDFRHIHSFFKEADIKMVGMQPDDAMVGGDPFRAKCARDDKTIIVYLANPSGTTPETDSPATGKPSVRINLPAGKYSTRWFNPRTGVWTEGKPCTGGAKRTFTAPQNDGISVGDSVVLFRRK